jgi:hypothetical protein
VSVCPSRIQLGALRQQGDFFRARGDKWPRAAFLTSTSPFIFMAIARQWTHLSSVLCPLVLFFVSLEVSSAGAESQAAARSSGAAPLEAKYTQASERSIWSHVELLKTIARSGEPVAVKKAVSHLSGVVRPIGRHDWNVISKWEIIYFLQNHFFLQSLP